MAEHPIQGLMNVTMDKIRQMADSNTIDRALTMLPELVDKVSALLKKEEKKDAAAPAAPAAKE